MKVDRHRQIIANAMSEAELKGAIIDMAHTFGWLVHHDRPARRKDGSWSTPIEGDAGFPDLLLAKKGRVVIAELKRQGERPDTGQRLWLDALHYGPVEVCVWRPIDWLNGSIGEVLTGKEPRP